MVKRTLLPLILIVATISFVTATYKIGLTLDQAVSQRPIQVKKAEKIFTNINASILSTQKKPILEKKIKSEKSKEEKKLEWLETKFKGIAFKVVQDFYNENFFIIDQVVLGENFDVLYSRYRKEFDRWKLANEKSELLLAKSTENFEEKFRREVVKGLTSQELVKQSSKKLPSKKLVEDEVKTKLAAPVTLKSDKNKSLTAYEIAKRGDAASIEAADIVVFDYSKGADKNSKSFENIESSRGGPIEPPQGGSVELAASNEAPSVQPKHEKPLPAAGPIGPTLAEVSSHTRPTKPTVKALPSPSEASHQAHSQYKPTPSDIVTSQSLAFARGEEGKNNAFATIEATHFKFREGILGSVNDIELRVAHTDADRFQDMGTGTIVVEKSLNSKRAVTRGTLLGSKVFDTSFDLHLVKGEERNYKVPTFDRYDFEKFLESQEYFDEGGFLFVELDSLTESVQIDSPFFKKIYLSRNLKPVEQDADYYYLLFLGVEPGTTTLTITRNGKEVYQKLALIEYDNIFFEPNIYVDIPTKSIELKEKSLFGKDENPLILDGKQVREYSTTIKLSKSGPNQYAFNHSVVPFGTKRMLNLDHMGAPIWFSFWDEESVTIPSENYLANMMNLLNLESLENICLIQIDLEKRVRQFTAIGRTGESFIGGDQIFLREDGSLEDYISLNSIKAFLLGDENSQVNIHLEYDDGTEDWVSSVCTPGNYFIETP